MSAMEKSDLPEVARKRANNAVSAAAEPVERERPPFSSSKCGTVPMPANRTGD